jgi:hypothetical protein
MNVETPRKQETMDSIFHSLPQEEQAAILSIGAAFRRLSLEKQLARAKSKVKEFEARYHTTLDQLETDGLPDDADYAMHEDYIEWHYWSRVMERTQKTLDALAVLSPQPKLV